MSLAPKHFNKNILYIYARMYCTYSPEQYKAYICICVRAQKNAMLELSGISKDIN